MKLNLKQLYTGSEKNSLCRDCVGVGVYNIVLKAVLLFVEMVKPSCSIMFVITGYYSRLVIQIFEEQLMCYSSCGTRVRCY